MKLVKDILHNKGRTVWTIEPNATVQEALTEMAAKDIGAIVVTENERVVGVISERDYARKVILNEKSPFDTLVRDLMTNDPPCVTPGHTLAECMSCFTDECVQHLPVLDEGNNLGGIVSIGDVVAAIISDYESKIDELDRFVYGT